MSTNGNKNTPLIFMDNITMRFGLIEALHQVDFSIQPAEIVGLVGDNGAGKSTLIKVLTGMHTPSEGTIYIDGQPVVIDSPKTARALGIETVYQDLALVNLMSIARNFYLGREPVERMGPFNFMDKQVMNARAVEALDHIGIEIRRPEEEVMRLSGGERQSIAIGRAVHFGSKLLILDEPTSALSVGETQKVLNYTQEAKKAGLSVIFITHNIGHVYQVADRFTIISHGEKVGDFTKDQVNEQEIADMIMGGPIPERLQTSVQELAVELRSISDGLTHKTGATFQAARKRRGQRRWGVLAVVAALILAVVLFLNSGAINREIVLPTSTPTATPVAEVPQDVLDNIDQLENATDASQRALAAARLGNADHGAAVPPLIAALEDEDDNVRRGAARAIGRLGIAEVMAFDPLVILLRDNQSEVRDAAAETLNILWGVSCSASDPCPTPIR